MLVSWVALKLGRGCIIQIYTVVYSSNFKVGHIQIFFLNYNIYWIFFDVMTINVQHPIMQDKLEGPTYPNWMGLMQLAKAHIGSPTG